MNINQMQNFDQVESLKGKESIKEVEKKADDNLKKIEDNPEQKKATIDRIKDKLGLNKT